MIIEDYLIKVNKLWIIISIVLIIIAGLVVVFIVLGRSQIMDGDGMERKFTYTQIPQSQAKEMMDNDESVIVVDVTDAGESYEVEIQYVNGTRKQKWIINLQSEVGQQMFA